MYLDCATFPWLLSRNLDINLSSKSHYPILKGFVSYIGELVLHVNVKMQVVMANSWRLDKTQKHKKLGETRNQKPKTMEYICHIWVGIWHMHCFAWKGMREKIRRPRPFSILEAWHCKQYYDTLLKNPQFSGLFQPTWQTGHASLDKCLAICLSLRASFKATIRYIVNRK